MRPGHPFQTGPETPALRGQVQGWSQPEEPLRIPWLADPGLSSGRRQPTPAQGSARSPADATPPALRGGCISLANSMQTPWPVRDAPPCCLRPPAFLRRDSGRGREGQGWEGADPAPPQPPSPYLGAPPRLGVPSDCRPRGVGPAARGVSRSCPPHLASGRPHLAPAPRRGRGRCGEGRARLNPGGAGRRPRSERTGREPSVERAGGTPRPGAGRPPSEGEAPARRSAPAAARGGGATRPRAARGCGL